MHSDRDANNNGTTFNKTRDLAHRKEPLRRHPACTERAGPLTPGTSRVLQKQHKCPEQMLTVPSSDFKANCRKTHHRKDQLCKSNVRFMNLFANKVMTLVNVGKYVRYKSGTASAKQQIALTGYI